MMRAVACGLKQLAKNNDKDVVFIQASGILQACNATGHAGLSDVCECVLFPCGT